MRWTDTFVGTPYYRRLSAWGHSILASCANWPPYVPVAYPGDYRHSVCEFQRPDIVITDVRRLDYYCEEDHVTWPPDLTVVIVTIRNLGGHIWNSDKRLWFNRSITLEHRLSDAQLGPISEDSQEITAPACGGATDIVYDFMPGLTSSITISLEVDATDRIAEHDEANNVLEKDVEPFRPATPMGCGGR